MLQKRVAVSVTAKLTFDCWKEIFRESYVARYVGFQSIKESIPAVDRGITQPLLSLTHENWRNVKKSLTNCQSLRIPEPFVMPFHHLVGPHCFVDRDKASSDAKQPMGLMTIYTKNSICLWSWVYAASDELNNVAGQERMCLPIKSSFWRSANFSDSDVSEAVSAADANRLA